MMKFVMSVAAVICIILLIVAKVGCKAKTATPWIVDTGRDKFLKTFSTRTPYLQKDNWFGGARGDNRKSATEGASRTLGWWWRFIGELRRTLEKKAPATTTAARSDPSQRPETIVTYSIKGCSPTIVPFDLSPCSNSSPDVPQPVSTTRVIYYVPPLSRIDRHSAQ